MMNSTQQQGNIICSCGPPHYNQPNHSLPPTTTMLFSSIQNNNKSNYETDMYPFAASSVDCTLSLATPSTRVEADDKQRRSNGSCMSNFCWDLLHTTKTTPSVMKSNEPERRGNIGNNGCSRNDSLLARRCANCDTTTTPLWRNGPRGPKSLCNACGIRFKKEERRATAANTPSAPVEVNNNYNFGNNTTNSWVHHHAQNQKLACYNSTGNEFRFINDNNDRESDTTVPFLSWRFNVTDRPSLVHDFTR